MNRSIGRWRAPRRVRGAAGIAAATALALVAAGCGAGAGAGGGGAVPGVTEDTIKLGTTQPLTGPAAPGYAKISKAMTAYFEKVNAEGGIHGRKIELIVEDDGYNPTNTATKTRKLVQRDKVFALAGALGTPTHTAVLDFIRQNKIPDLMVSSGSLSWNQPDKYPYTFGWQTDYVREGKILATHAKENFPDKTYCSFVQGDDLGADGVKGLEIVLGEDALKTKESYSVSNTNVAPAIGKLQAADCDVVFGFMIPGFTSLALKTAAKLDYEAQWVISAVGADPAALEGYLGDGAESLTQGLVATSYLPLVFDKKNSWIKLFAEINDEYNDGAPFDMTTLHGYAMSYAIAQALVAAGENPTREGLVEAIESSELVAGPSPTAFSYSADDHSGMTGMFVTTIDKLEIEQVSPAYVTDSGDGPVEEYKGEQTEAPANGIPG